MKTEDGEPSEDTMCIFTPGGNIEVANDDNYIYLVIEKDNLVATYGN